MFKLQFLSKATISHLVKTTILIPVDRLDYTHTVWELWCVWCKETLLTNYLSLVWKEYECKSVTYNCMYYFMLTGTHKDILKIKHLLNYGFYFLSWHKRFFTWFVSVLVIWTHGGRNGGVCGRSSLPSWTKRH